MFIIALFTILKFRINLNTLWYAYNIEFYITIKAVIKTVFVNTK